MKTKHKIIAFIFSILALVLSIAVYKTSMENRKIHKMEKEFMIEIINDLEEEKKKRKVKKMNLLQTLLKITISLVKITLVAMTILVKIIWRSIMLLTLMW